MAADDAKQALLRKVSLFAGLGGRDLDEVARLADMVDLPAGTVLMRQGANGNEMFVISSGSVRVDRDGSELARLGAGDVFGEIALLSEGPRTATVTTLEPTTVFVLAHREFHTLMESSPAVRQCVYDALASRIRTLEEHRAH
jgi:CRP/FNR family transcriptional regulator, cyclic AMP receptor protein